jgi:hypothetical protein
VTNDIPERSDLLSGSCSSDADGANIRIRQEDLFLYENEDVSQFELLISAGNAEI